MWSIVGVDKVTGKLVEVATATNATEKARILSEERLNYFQLRAVRIV
jgi:hypothetical protein